MLLPPLYYCDLDLSRPCWAMLGSKLVRKQICLYGIFPVRQLNAIATPFINAIVTLKHMKKVREQARNQLHVQNPDGT